jgi:hypothetical protein
MVLRLRLLSLSALLAVSLGAPAIQAAPARNTIVATGKVSTAKRSRPTRLARIGRRMRARGRLFRRSLRHRGAQVKNKIALVKSRVVGGGKAVVRGAGKLRSMAGNLARATPGALKKAARWSKKHPGKAAGIALGTAAMFATVFWAAPALSAGVSSWLTPLVGKSAAGIFGIASGGALASGARSLLVHSTPMVLGVDPFNKRQLAVDVGMSSGFGFAGFAQAAAMRQITGLTGVGGLALFATNAVGLIGYEVFKDYLQNRMRSKVANDPKSFRQIWKSSLTMETASNLHRCIPGLGLETNFAAKIIGDLGGTIWWDRIVNSRNDKAAKGPVTAKTRRQQKTAHQAAHDALTE